MGPDSVGSNPKIDSGCFAALRPSLESDPVLNISSLILLLGSYVGPPAPFLPLYHLVPLLQGFGKPPRDGEE